MNGYRDAVISALTWLAAVLLAGLGGWDVWLASLISLRVMDWMSGGLHAAIDGKRFDREKFIRGWVITAGYFVAIWAAVVIDRCLVAQGLDTHEGLRLLTCIYLVGKEAHSIYGHLNALGLELPVSITGAIEHLRDKKQ